MERRDYMTTRVARRRRVLPRPASVLARPRELLGESFPELLLVVAVALMIRGLALEYADRLTVATVDVDADPQLAARYGVRSLPTVMLLEDGEVRRVLVGARSSQEYRAAI